MLLNSLSGRTFELGFKIGFLQSVKQSTDIILYETQEGVKRYNIEEKIKEYLKSVSKEKHGEIIYRLAEEGILEKKEKGISLYNRLIEKVNIDEYNQDSVLVGHYITGWHTGYELGTDFRVKKDKNTVKSRPVFFMFDILQEKNQKGGWQNADVIIHEGNTLHVYDIKSAGGVRTISKFYSGETITLPPTVSGFNLYLSLGRGCPSLQEFIENFERITKGKDITQGIELIQISQVFSYLFDFLEKKWFYVKDKYRIEEISVGIINPFLGNSFYKWHIADCLGKSLIERGKIFKEFYKTARSFFLVSKENVKESIRQQDSFNILFAIKQLKREKEKIIQKLEELKKNWITITPKKSIEDLRKDVRKAVKETRERFFKNTDIKVVGLLHSAGAGKTTSIIDEFLKENKEYPVLMIYVAPRKKLIEQIENKVKEIDNVGIIKIEEEEEEQGKGQGTKRRIVGLIVKGKAHRKTKQDEYRKGNIGRAVDIIKETINKDKSKKLHYFASLTTQSWLRNVYTHTNRHLEKLTDEDLKGRKLIIVLDEVLGSENGLDALTKLIDFVSIREALLFVLDMNLHSKQVLEKVLEEYNSVKFLAPSLYITDLDKVEGEFSYEEIPIRVYSGYSFPAKKIRYKSDYVITRGKKEKEGVEKVELFEKIKKEKVELFEKIKKYIDEVDYKVFVYIQNKALIEDLLYYLNGTEYKGRVAFFNSVKEHEEGIEAVNNENIKVFIATSTLSRGVSLGNDVRRTIIVNTGMTVEVENFLTEELQSLARMRGGQDDVEKDIVRIIHTHINEEEDIDIESRIAFLFEDEIVDYGIREKVAEFIREIDEYNIYSSFYSYELLARNIFMTFVDAKEYKDRIGLVPISSQYERFFKPSVLEEMKNLKENLRILAKQERDILIREGIKRKVKGKEKEASLLYPILRIIDNLYNSVISEVVVDEYRRLGFCLYKTKIRAIQNIDKQANLILFLRKNWENIKRILKEVDAKEDFIKILEELKRDGVLPVRELIEDEVAYIYMPLYAFVEDMLCIGKQMRVRRNRYLGKTRIKSKYNDIEEEINVGRTEAGKTFLVFPLNGIQSLSYLSGNYPVFSKDFVFELIEK